MGTAVFQNALPMSIKAELCIDYGNAGPLLTYVCNMNTSEYVTKYMHTCITMASISNRESVQFSSVQFSHSVVSDSLRPHESQHARPPCPSPTPRVH